MSRAFTMESGRYSPYSPPQHTSEFSRRQLDLIRRPQATRRRSRKSVFKEHISDDEGISQSPVMTPQQPSSLPQLPRQPSTIAEELGQEMSNETNEIQTTIEKPSWYSNFGSMERPQLKAAANGPPSSFSSVSRVALITCLIAMVVPSLRSSLNGEAVNGADAGLIPNEVVQMRTTLNSRDTSPTDVCTRWSHQSANINGTLYIYGGQATTESGQTTDTWNNNFLTVDLTKTWQISSPSLTGLPQPSGPPAVANGYLWSTYDSLFLYGGEFADNPSASPSPVSTWEYAISSQSWIEHSSPTTSSGNNSADGGVAVQRSAEGAGLSVPQLGVSYYFGGHQDLYTTEGWSNQIERIYLKSLLEFTHPDYTNTGVQSLADGSGAGSDGVYRNITEGGLQDDAGFTERADGVLVFVPGWGDEGILLGLAGGTADKYTEMNEIDVYDIATSTWYKQATSGSSPNIRVNPCAVVAAASDFSSFQVYMYAGQSLQPAGNQTQYSDVWILSVPSFTWIFVDTSDQSEPPARAGHTCDIMDGQMIVVGGYVGTEISCDSPGVYNFNLSSLAWTNTFTSLSSSSDSSGSSGSSGSDDSSGSDSGSSDSSGSTIAVSDPAGAAMFPGSNGYQVPDIVISVIGGSGSGGATATTPAAGAGTVGPIATGKSPAITITQSGSTITATATNSPTSTSTSTSKPSAAKGKNLGAIIAGVIAGLLALLAAYLGWCTWLYRRQLGLYKDHVAMAQRASLGAYRSSAEREKAVANTDSNIQRPGAILGAFGTDISNSTSHSGQASTDYGIYGGMGYDEGRGASYESQWPGTDNGHSGSSSTEDLMGNLEPSFLGVVMSPRRTLRVINRD